MWHKGNKQSERAGSGAKMQRRLQQRNRRYQVGVSGRSYRCECPSQRVTDKYDVLITAVLKHCAYASNQELVGVSLQP
jgi:ribosome modulation factor